MLNNMPTRIPDINVEITGTLVFLLTRENNLNINPSCDIAYNRRGSGTKAINVEPKNDNNKES